MPSRLVRIRIGVPTAIAKRRMKTATPLGPSYLLLDTKRVVNTSATAAIKFAYANFEYGFGSPEIREIRYLSEFCIGTGFAWVTVFMPLAVGVSLLGT